MAATWPPTQAAPKCCDLAQLETCAWASRQSPQQATSTRACNPCERDNTGYAIKDLLVGSEGTLGILTAATLRLYPRPASQQAALITCPDLRAAVSLLTLARQHLDACLTGLEVIHRDAFLLAQQHTPHQAHVADALMASDNRTQWLVLLDAAGPQNAAALQDQLETLIDQAIDQQWAFNATLSQNDTQYRAMWQLRETIPMAEKIEGQMVKHDIAVPTSSIPDFVDQCQTVLTASFPGSRVICFGHLGDGNLHYNVQGPRSQSDADFLKQKRASRQSSCLRPRRPMERHHFSRTRHWSTQEI